MRSFKSIFGVAGAVVPIGYCGYLVYYFLDLSGSVKEAWDTGLGPTVLGLGVVALLFCIPLAWKLIKMFSGPRWPRSGGRPGAPPGYGDEDEDDANEDRVAAADAAIARYMARKSAEAAARVNAPSGRPAQQRGGRRPSFGRKNG